jgi:tryptophan halogenase
LKSKNKTYEYDFYVDCTGFARLLIGKLGSKWQSYSKFLKMKEAIVFPTREETEIPMWTLARAMNSGWMFRIPVWGRKGNGYIFDSDHITADEAKIEAEKYLGFEVDVAKHIKFNPGAVDKPWINNVCAIGLSASFVEPLEASSIGTSINQSFILANRIIHYNQDVIDRYNKEVDAIMNNIRDFIVLHYISPRRDTEFWRSVAEVELPDTLKANLNMWKHRLPIIDDFTSYTKKVLFNEYNHTLVMYGMGLFDQEKIMAQYDSVPQEAKHYTERQIQTKLDYDKVKTIPHKMMLDLIRRLS